MMIRLASLLPLSALVFLGAACEHVSLNYVDGRPRREVHVVERPAPREVHVIEHHPVREVHVVEQPVTEVHIHQPHLHVCSDACDHYYDGARFVVVSHGHRHGPGCGHVHSGKHWTVAKSGKAREVPRSTPTRKYRQN